MIDYIVVFFFVLLVDIFWTQYLISVQNRKVLFSGIYAALIYLLGAYVVILYNNNHNYIFIATIASFIGTTLTVKYKKIQEENPKYFKRMIKRYIRKFKNR